MSTCSKCKSCTQTSLTRRNKGWRSRRYKKLGYFGTPSARRRPTSGRGSTKRSRKLAKQFRAGRTRKKRVTLKGGKISRISARREFNAGAKIGTRYKVPNSSGGYT